MIDYNKLKAGMMTAFLLVAPGSVFAQDPPEVATAPEGSKTTMVVPAKHDPDAGEASIEKIYSKGEAYRMSTNQVVLHYGKGIYSVDTTATILNKTGIPAIAIPGGPDGKVRLFVGRNKNKLIYDQNDVDGGVLAHKADLLYNASIGKRPVEPVVQGKKGEPLAFNIQ